MIITTTFAQCVSSILIHFLGLATFEWNNEDLIVTGTGGHFYTSNTTATTKGCSELYMGNAGTATRFITSVLTLSGRSETPGNPERQGITITGSKRGKYLSI